jgi:hypothetical protein
MVEINVPNFLTITIIALVGIAAVKFGLSFVGMKPSWL